MLGTVFQASEHLTELKMSQQFQGRLHLLLELSCQTESPPEAQAGTRPGGGRWCRHQRLPDAKLQQQLSLPVRLVNLPEKENLFSVSSGLFPGD